MKVSAASDHLGQLYEIIITGSIDLQFLAVLPETYTFWKNYVKLRYDSGGGCNFHKYTGQILWQWL